MRVPRPSKLLRAAAQQAVEAGQDLFTYRGRRYRLIPCPGQAHSNAFIDSCGLCAPMWGWLISDEGRAS